MQTQNKGPAFRSQRIRHSEKQLLLQTNIEVVNTIKFKVLAKMLAICGVIQLVQ